MNKRVIKLVRAVRKDIERYLDDPSDFRSEYFEDVLLAIQEAEELIEKEQTK